MRVLHVGKYYPPAPGGMERVVQMLCEHERPQVDSRALVANTDASTIHEVRSGVPVTRVGRLAAIGSVGVCPGFPRELGRTRRDITVLHEPNPLALVSDFVARQRGPLVVWYHSDVLRPRWKYRLVYRPFLRRALERAARIVVSSPPLADYATELGDLRYKCEVIPFGVDLRRLALRADDVAQVEELRAASSLPLVLFVGRLVPYKGILVLLDALRRVEARAVIAGDGPMRTQVEARIDELGLQSRVHVTGEVSDREVVALYHACDLFVLPSITRAETFGVAQLEAMACGKAVVSTSVPSGVPWVNQHGTSGLVVRPGDAADLADAIATLLMDTGLRQRLGTQARMRVEREFTAERMAMRTTELYEDVLRKAG